MLSTARINAKLAAGARASSRARVVAVASRQRARAEAQARELGVERAHGSYEALLADPDVDAVYISLPNEMHHEWTMHAHRGGQARALREAATRARRPTCRRAFDAAEAAGVVLAEAFMWRHHPQALKARRARLRRRDRRAPPRARGVQLPARRSARRAAARGARRRRPDGCRLLLRERRAHARRRSRERDGAAAARALGRRPAPRRDARPRGDVLAHFDCGLDLPDRSDLEAAGSGGQPAGERSVAQHGRRASTQVRDDGHGEHFDIPVADPYGCELDDLAGAVAGEHPPRLGASRRARSGAHDPCALTRRRRAAGRRTSEGFQGARLRRTAGGNGAARARGGGTRGRGCGARRSSSRRRSGRMRASTADVRPRDARARERRARGSRRPRRRSRSPSAAGAPDEARRAPCSAAEAQPLERAGDGAGRAGAPTGDRRAARRAPSARRWSAWAKRLTHRQRRASSTEAQTARLAP